MDRASEISGIGRASVGRYLRAWDLMAEFGEVPGRNEMQPGEDVKLPDMSVWTKFYREANQAKQKPEKKKEDPKQAEEQPPTPLDTADVDMSDASESPRVAKVYGMAMDAVEDFPGPVGDQLRRMLEALSDMAVSDNPKHAYMRAFHALSEIPAAINEMKSIGKG